MSSVSRAGSFRSCGRGIPVEGSRASTGLDCTKYDEGKSCVVMGMEMGGTMW